MRNSTKVKKILIFILCLLLVFSITTTAMAVNAIPKDVLQATESVVRVMAEYSDGYSYGTGFIVKSDEYSTLIATNYHVVAGEPMDISVWLSDTATSITWSIAGAAPQRKMNRIRPTERVIARFAITTL